MLRRFMFGVMLAAGLLLLAPAPQAEASSWGWWSSGDGSHTSVRHRRYRRYRWYQHYRHRGQQYRQRREVPELDPAAAGSALVLLIGGIAYIASRRREEDELA